MKVADLSTEELKNLIREAVEEKLRELLGDPDWGLKLREEVKERLVHSLAAIKKEEKGIGVEEVAERFGL